tara:strand:- start:3464 stop:3646 length:183 start_codon:yes stop_codon:yes gene_type:complete
VYNFVSEAIQALYEVHEAFFVVSFWDPKPEMVACIAKAPLDQVFNNPISGACICNPKEDE